MEKPPRGRYDEPMSANWVTLERDGPVAIVSLNRPDRLNAYGWELGGVFAERINEASSDPEVRAIVVRGNGRAFCAGLDLKSNVQDRIVGRSPAEQVRNYYERFRMSHRRTQAIEDVPQPTIFALHGYCFGAGMEISLLGDIRVASENAVFCAPEVKIGVAIDGGLDMRLCEEVGPGWAKWITLTGRRFDARKALEIGLVQEVHPADELRDRALELAHEIAENAPLAVQGTKRTINMWSKRGLNDALKFEAMSTSTCFVSEDLLEGYAAGGEKRKARFEGK
ncbi:MAG: enoyl-CoA hydratase/isomerase family protein [Candidatus Binatia bacterium]|nr:enoyl-CoA hydratase/isomerase family protein [Candidatus Binatia bacterium]